MGVTEECVIGKKRKTAIPTGVKNKYGQYFTPKIFADFMVSIADLTPQSLILEPACGEGIFINSLLEKGFRNIDAYEIDRELGTVYPQIKYESFVSAEIIKRYDLVIGNPPYIRWKNLEKELKSELINHPLWNCYFNSLCDYLFIFILKSISLLKDDGQLIFICPEYWMNTTHSSGLRTYMMKHGYFESIYHFSEAPIFDNASLSTIVFKFRKTSDKKPKSIQIVKYEKNKTLSAELLREIRNGKENTDEIKRFTVAQFSVYGRWMLSSREDLRIINRLEKVCIEKKQQTTLFDLLEENRYSSIGDVCDIGNGMVSGFDKAFQIDTLNLNKLELQSVIQVVKAKDVSQYIYAKTTPYIFVNQVEQESIFKSDYPNFYSHLLPHINQLGLRYNYNKELKYWQWAFLRNYNLFRSDRPRILVPCKERISHKNYFRFCFAPARIFPTQDVTAIFPKIETRESIYYILAYLNDSRVFTWLTNKGVIKGNIVEFSERPIASIPFRRIDWNNPTEVMFHDEIVERCKYYIKTEETSTILQISNALETLLNLPIHEN